jgi:hypothetical protein
MATKFYSVGLATWRIGNMLVPRGKYILDKVDSDRFLVRNTENLVVILELQASQCQREDLTFYADYDTLLAESSDFFISVAYLTYLGNMIDILKFRTNSDSELASPGEIKYSPTT